MAGAYTIVIRKQDGRWHWRVENAINVGGSAPFLFLARMFAESAVRELARESHSEERYRFDPDRNVRLPASRVPDPPLVDPRCPIER